MDGHVFTINDLDDSKGKFAIEMELGYGNTGKAYKIWEELGGNSAIEINAHYECGERIVENTVFSNNFERKFQLFNKMCTRERGTIGTDCSIAGGCHCHIFFKEDLHKKYFDMNLNTHLFRSRVALYSYMIPFYLRSGPNGIYIRKRGYDVDFYPPEGDRGDIKNNHYSKSIEFRNNEQVHGAVLYYRLFISTRVSLGVDINTSFTGIRDKNYDKGENFPFWNKETLIPTKGHDKCSALVGYGAAPDLGNKGLSSFKVMKANSNLGFKSHLRLITIDVRDLEPAYYYDWFYKEDIVREFIAFNEYINQYVPNHHKKDVYKFFSENMRGYPKDWKRDMLLGIPVEDRKNRSSMLKSIPRKLPTPKGTILVKGSLMNNGEIIEQEVQYLVYKDLSFRAIEKPKLEERCNLMGEKFLQYCKKKYNKAKSRYEDDYEEDYDEDYND